jgi:hypothetical protein
MKSRRWLLFLAVTVDELPYSLIQSFSAKSLTATAARITIFRRIIPAAIRPVRSHPRDLPALLAAPD